MNIPAIGRPLDSIGTRQMEPDTGAALLRSFRLIMARKWMIAAITVAVFVGMIFIVNAMTPIYQSKTMLLVETNTNKVVSIESIVGNAIVDRDFFATQVEFLKSRGVIARTIRDLKLVENPLFDPTIEKTSWVDDAIATIRDWGVSLAGWAWPPIEGLVGKSSPSKSVPLPEEKRDITDDEAKLIRVVERSLTVRPIWKSKLIGVSFDSPDPELAAQIANSITASYIQSDLDARFEVTLKASLWLNERLKQIGTKLHASEANLERLRAEAGIIRTPGSAGAGAARQMDTASVRFVQARVALAQIEQVYRQVRPGANDRYSVPQVFNNPSVVQARSSLSTAERALEDAKQRLGPLHPEFLRASADHDAARANWVAQSEAVISSIAKQYQVARSTERAVRSEIASARSSILDDNRKEVSLDSAEREVSTLRQLYQTFLARVKETGATADFQSPVARVIDAATPAERPIRPKKAQLIVLATFLAFIFSAALALLLERMNRKIKRSDDVAMLLDQPLLSAIPHEAKSLKSGLLKTHPQRSKELFGESMRTAVVGIQLSLLDVPSPIIGVTSTVTGEGKSTVAASLALELATRKRVLLIDADLRRPSISAKLGLDPVGPGLSDLINGSASVDECVKYLPEVNLFVLRGGRKSKNPLDLLFSEALEGVLEDLSTRYGTVIIDTPPVELVSDALVIARLCSGMAYVVKSDSTDVSMIRRGIQRLTSANLRLFGVVLNSHDFKKATSYYGDSSAHGQYAYDYGRDG